jgi:hypothetical protein
MCVSYKCQLQNSVGEALELVVGVEVGVGIVQPDHQAWQANAWTSQMGVSYKRRQLRTASITRVISNAWRRVYITSLVYITTVVYLYTSRQLLIKTNLAYTYTPPT